MQKACGIKRRIQMTAKKIYQKDVNAYQCTARITGIAVSGDSTAVTLDQTVFFPTGGGQPCDLGTIGGIQLTDVYEHDDEIFHVIDTADASDLHEGDAIECLLDRERRFDNMQRHCGEHILSGVFFREYGGVNRGFHMGSDHMTVDIRLEKDPSFSKITWAMAMHAEKLVNDVICSDIPVTVRYFGSRREAEAMPVRKALTLDSDISIVCIGDPAEPADCVACCGTHPKTTGQVGLLKIYKVEKNKDMWRIYFEAGSRAMKDYDRKHDMLTEISIGHSAGTDDLLAKLAAEKAKENAVHDRLRALLSHVIRTAAADISTDIENGVMHTLYEFPYLEAEEIMHIGSEAGSKSDRPLCITGDSPSVLFLFSDGSCDCGRIVRENAPACGGRGGGKAGMARVSFADKASADQFMKKISAVTGGAK